MSRWPFNFHFAADNILLKLFMEARYGNISRVMRNTILLEPLFLLIKVVKLLELSFKLLKRWNVSLFCCCHYLNPIIFKEKWSDTSLLRDGNPCCVLFIYVEGDQWLYDSFHHHQRQHHHIVSPARISLTLSRHSSLSFITSGRSSWLHPVSSPSCRM